jgi:ABC-type transport system involved in Fe-S cluster assembly fused permease/ATPase subunit
MSPRRSAHLAKPSHRADIRIVGRLLPYLWTHAAPGLRTRVALAVLCLVAAKVATVIVPLFYKRAVDALSYAGAHPAALVAVPVLLIVAYGAARVTSQALNELRQMVFAKVAQNAVHVVALETFRHMHRLSLRFHLDRQTGGLSRAIERGTTGIDNLLHFLLFQIVPTLLEIGMVSAILWWFYDWRFAAVTFVTILAYIGFTLSLTQWRLKFRRRMLDAESEAHTKAIDSLLNYETVKYFSNEDHEARRYDRSLAAYERASVLSENTLSLLNAGQGLVIAIGVTCVMLLAGAGVAGGTMTIGDFVLVNAYLIQLYMPLNFLGMVYRELRQALTDMTAMFRVIEEQVEIEDAPGAAPLAVSGGEIVFDHVGFGYDARRRILHDLSFTVKAGHTAAIVGPSGAGKSTISRLLFRFYDVDQGTIRIDGQDLCRVTQASLRAAIGIVPQDTVLFNDTIYYNIAYGRPEASPAEVEHAARLARIHDFIMGLPEGYQTRVGERGLKLSGGERQRVAIARTILKRPRLLLFDEATSALDTRTEKAIQESLSQLSQGVTTLVIAHRLSTVVHADEILVLDKGRIAERGRHAELVARGGLYAQMWQRQLEAGEQAEPAEGVAVA